MTGERNAKRSGPGVARPDGFTVSFADGRGLLCANNLCIGNIAVVDRLELLIPQLSFPFDLSGGVKGLIHHRLKLGRMKLTLFAEGIEQWVRRRFEASGLFSLWGLSFETGVIEALVHEGSPKAERTLALRLVPVLTENGLSLLTDFPAAIGPVSGNLLRTAALMLEAATGLRPAGCRTELPDLVQAALVQVLPERGQRLPDSTDTVLTHFEIHPDRIVLTASHPELESAVPEIFPDEANRLRALKLKEEIHIADEGDRAVTEDRPDDGRRVYAKLLERSPDNPVIAARIGALDVVRPEFRESAAALLSDGLQRHPKNRALTAVLLHAAALRDDRETERSMLECLVDNGESLERFAAGMRLGESWTDESPKKAVGIFERIAGARREDGRVLSALMHAAAKEGDLNRVRHVVPRLIAVQSTAKARAAAHVSAGSLLLSLDDTFTAISHFERAISADGENADAQWGLAQALEVSGNIARAADRYESLARKLREQNDERGAATALFRLASLWTEKREFDLAVQRLRESLEADAAHPPRRLHLARLLVETGNPAEALREAETALHRSAEVDSDTFEAEALSFLAELYLDEFDDAEAARVAARKCLQSPHRDERCTEILKRALARKGFAGLTRKETSFGTPGEALEAAEDALLISDAPLALDILEEGALQFFDNVEIADVLIDTCRNVGDAERLYKALSERIDTVVSPKRRAEMEIELGKLSLTHHRDPSAALCWFRQAEEKTPSQEAIDGIAAAVRGLMEQAEHLLAEGDTEAAEMIFQAVHHDTQHPGDYAATLSDAEAALAADDFSTASSLAAGLSLAPRDIRTRAAVLTAKVLAEEGNPEEAVHLLEQAAKTQTPQAAGLLYQAAVDIGTEYLESPNTVAAFFENLLQEEPEDASADRALIEVWTAAGKIEAAAEHLVNHRPLITPERLREAATLFAQAGKEDRAATVLEDLYHETDTIDDLFQLAEMLKRQGRYEVLIGMLEERRNEDARVDEMLKDELAVYTDRLKQRSLTGKPPYPNGGTADRNTPNSRGLGLPMEADLPLPALSDDDEGLDEKLSSAFNRLRRK